MGLFEAIFKIGFGVAFGFLVYETLVPMGAYLWHTGSTIILDMVVQQPKSIWSSLLLFALAMGLTIGLFIIIPIFTYTMIIWAYYRVTEEEKKIPFHDFTEQGDKAFFYGMAIFVYCSLLIIYKFQLI